MSSLPEELDFSKRREATPERMNLAMAYLLGRLRAVESVKPDVDSVLNDLRTFGLERVAQALTPTFNQITDFADQLREMIDELVVDSNLTVGRISLTAPEVVNAGQNWYKTPLLVPAPPPLLNSVGGNDAVNFGIIGNCGLFDQGPTGHRRYFDTVIAFGLNLNGSFTRLNPAMPACSYRIESKFAQGQPDSVFGAEFHPVSLFPVDSPDEFRGISVWVPHKKADWAEHSDISFRGSRQFIYDGLNRVRVQWDFRPGMSRVGYPDTDDEGHVEHWFGVNNQPVARQLNHAGTAYLPLPYVNASDNIELPGAVYIVTPTAMTPLGVRAAATINVTEGADDEYALLVSTPPVAGNFFASGCSGSAGYALIHQIFNNGAGAGMLEIQTLNGAGNDALIAFSNVGGGKVWTIGYDNSDGDKLKIENSYRSVGDAAACYVEFDADKGATAFTKPVALPPYTLANLPSAVTVGAGAQAFCTNEAGGAVPVFSDGVNWRRVTDRAIAA